MKYFKSLLLFLVICLVGCEQQQSDKGIDSSKQNNTQSESTEETVTASNDQNIAKVGDWFITQKELDFMTERTLGSSTLAVMYDQVGEKLLKSMVASKSMAQQAFAGLSGDEKMDLELKVKAYKEELLVRQYLVENAKVKPVTEQMIRDYYQKHPDKFGGITKIHYRLIKTINLSSDQLNTASKLFSNINQKNNWQAVVTELKEQNIVATVQSAEVNPMLLSKTLKRLLKNTAIDELPAVTEINGNLYRLEVLSETKMPAKTLHAVSSDIRKLLAPVQLKRAIKSASEEAVKNITVEYY